MEHTDPTPIDRYFSYWQKYIQPIEEEKIRAQFDEILTEVGLRLYGVDFALELNVLFLQAQHPATKGEHSGE